MLCTCVLLPGEQESNDEKPWVGTYLKPQTGCLLVYYVSTSPPHHMRGQPLSTTTNANTQRMLACSIETADTCILYRYLTCALGISMV